MTGRYCNCTGVWHTIGGRSLLRNDERTMADIFRANGYRTGMFGKWHLGDNYPYKTPWTEVLRKRSITEAEGLAKHPITGEMTTLTILMPVMGSKNRLRGIAPMSGSMRRCSSSKQTESVLSSAICQLTLHTVHTMSRTATANRIMGVSPRLEPTSTV